MALTRTISVRNRIFNAGTLALLLDEITSHYGNSADPHLRGRLSLQISEDENTTISLDAPPKSFESLLSMKMHYLYLRFDSYGPSKSIELKLSPGSETKHNTIILHGQDEDWVNLTYSRITKILDNADKQSTFLHKHAVWLLGPLTLLVGWPLKNIFMQVLLWMDLAKLGKWSWGLLGQHTILALAFGVIPATMLLKHAQNCYPSLEIQTGPRHTWQAEHMRNRLRLIVSLVVLGPLANLFYDFYRFMYLA